MRRTDRLYALVEELRSRAPRPVPRADLARTLEVTARTVERDILALQQAGVPIWSQRGRGGGYALDDRWSLPPLNFDATEALAVIAALAAARSLPFAEAGRRAEQKVLAAMASGEAARAREVAGRLRLGSFGSGGARGIVTAVEEAVVARAVVELRYRDRHGELTSRPAEAHGLQLTPDGSYLMAWCRLRDAPRAFRIDRIVAVRPTGEAAPSRDLPDLLDRHDDTVAPALTTGGTVPTKRARASGPPRKAHHRTGSTPAYADAVASALPGTASTTKRDVTSHAVGGEAFLHVDADEGTAVVVDDGGGQTLLLTTVGRDDLRSTIEGAWAARAPKRSVTAHRKARAAWEALPPVTADDVRRVILALPGATEGPIWGSHVGFLIGTEKKTRFARFGPPDGDSVANLVAPDEEGTLVILRCEQRPELLAARPDRWFTTPHYGDPEEPGGVITRLSEHRGPDDLAELAELLEDAWREVATPDLVAQLG